MRHLLFMATPQHAYIITELLAVGSVAAPRVLRGVERERNVLLALATSDGVIRARLIDRNDTPRVAYLAKQQGLPTTNESWFTNIGKVTIKSLALDGGDINECALQNRVIAYRPLCRSRPRPFYCTVAQRRHPSQRADRRRKCCLKHCAHPITLAC